MKAALLTALKKIEIRDVAVPVIEKPDDVLLKVGAVGVCGSDVHYWARGRIGNQVVQYPFILGHEFGAEVVETGSGVMRVKPGDRVAVDPAMPCGTCDQCVCGRPHTCRRLRFFACPGQSQGCLCEYAVLPEGSCFPVRPQTSFELAALAEPLSIGVYAVKLSACADGPCGDLGGVPPRSIGILGAGPVGLSVLAALKTQNAGNVYITDRIDARVMFASQSGAVWAGNPDTADVEGAIALAVPELLDVVFECCGRQEALDQAVRLLKPGGMLVIVGIPETDRISFDISAIRQREITIRNVRRQNGCMEPAVDLAQSSLSAVQSMITHRFPLERAQEAFELVHGYRDGVVKAMILP